MSMFNRESAYLHISIQELRIFEMLMRTGSVRLVANNLNISQTTCNRAIASLEEKLGVNLFLRQKSEYKLTIKAMQLYEPILSLLKYDHQKNINGKQSARNVTFYFPIAGSYLAAKYLIPMLVKEFDELQAELITFTVSFLYSFPTYAPFVIDCMDFVFLNDEYSYMINSNIWKPLCQIPLTQKIYCSNRYLASVGAVKTPADLSQHKCLSLNVNAIEYWQFLDKNDQLYEVAIKPSMTIDSEALQAHAVDAGLGIARLTEGLIKGDQRADIIEILPDYRLPDFSSTLYVNRAYQDNEIIDKVVRFLSTAM
ncbi:LysR family transcriptional regulator [Facilibium subflavum]|uniref:LysR family transcriptional regulator n=1 Tax=Facilibium subflavum TaxID=2219058 RepID=UPI0013C31A50|nr:LysR family transcriptional regulator [Facilibium subflavum]